MKFLLSLLISFFLLSCEFELVDDDKGKTLETGSLQQDMASNGDIIYLISKDKIMSIDSNSISTSSLPGTTHTISFNERIDLKSIKKIANRVYVLDENKKIYIYDINSEQELVYTDVAITLNDEANNFEVFSDNNILIASYDTRSELFNIANINDIDSIVAIKNEIRLSYLSKDNNILYAISNLNQLIMYNLSDVRNVVKDKNTTIEEKINIISSNETYLFLASDENIFVYDFELNKISSFKIDRATSLLFYNDYLYVSRGLNGIDKLDISNIEEIKKIKKYDKGKDKNNKKILFNKNKDKIVIMRSSEISLINTSDFSN